VQLLALISLAALAASVTSWRKSVR
jgi:hypothetical protein